MQKGFFSGSQARKCNSKNGSPFCRVFRIFSVSSKAGEIGVQCNRKFQFRVTGILLLDRELLGIDLVFQSSVFPKVLDGFYGESEGNFKRHETWQATRHISM